MPFNFLDGLDGLLAGVTAISGLFLFAIASAHGHVGAALVLCALVGGALGFLPYNFNPAKIFLGDTGSLFIGYVFATVSLLITAKTAVTITLLVPLVALALPVVDTAAAIFRRFRAGRAITEADRSQLPPHSRFSIRVERQAGRAVDLRRVVSLGCGRVSALA